MQEFTYQLQKEDYMDWIHWNVGRQNLKKVQRITFIVYIVFLVLYIGGNIAAKRPPQALIPTLILMTALGFFMFHTVSAKHQEQVIWKRSGLKKLEKTGSFPTVHLTVREWGITMEVPGEVCKDYSFADIKEIKEIDRLFLLAAASDNTWQFVAKSVFESEEQKDEFKALLEEKIEDAKEHPEKYRKVTAAEVSGTAGAQGGQVDRISGQSGEADADEPEIKPVDTSNMGKIGKMAHIMAAMAAENAQEDAGEDTREAENAQEDAAEDVRKAESAQEDAAEDARKAETEPEPAEKVSAAQRIADESPAESEPAGAADSDTASEE